MDKWGYYSDENEIILNILDSFECNSKSPSKLYEYLWENRDRFDNRDHEFIGVLFAIAKNTRYIYKQNKKNKKLVDLPLITDPIKIIYPIPIHFKKYSLDKINNVITHIIDEYMSLHMDNFKMDSISNELNYDDYDDYNYNITFECIKNERKHLMSMSL